MRSLGRPLRLTADWGTANFFRICGWIANGLYERLGREGLCRVDTSQAWTDVIEALVGRTTDITIATPAEFAVQAREGVAQFEGRPHPEIRALALLPHDDAMLFAVPEESPYGTFDDLRSAEGLRVGLPPNDGYGLPGWVCHAVLAEYGLTRDVIEERGGELVERERPHLCPPLLLDGNVDLAMQEAMMLPQWRDLAQRRPIRFLSLDEAVLERFAKRYRLAARTIHAARFPGQTEPIRTIDFSGWLVIAHEELADEVAYEITSVMVETRADLERQFNANPIEVSPLFYPILPDHMTRTRGVPLHAGAEAYYRDRGLL